jgi:hypothetical protein
MHGSSRLVTSFAKKFNAISENPLLQVNSADLIMDNVTRTSCSQTGKPHLDLFVLQLLDATFSDD